MFRTAIGALVCLALLLPFSAARATECEQHQPADELKADVPALREFHEVIYPLWHNAWPNKDYELMKELLPQVREHVAAIRQAELPGILRDQRESWTKGVEALTATLSGYEQAAEADDHEALLAAVEQIHGDFESLARTVRPAMKELDAYHVVLYRIYHYYAPEQQVAELRQAAGELQAACAELKQAPAPRRHADKAERLGREVAELCTRTDRLGEVAAADEWDPIAEAVEQVHTQYQTVLGIFE
jgi:hypothetical protein